MNRGLVFMVGGDDADAVAAVTPLFEKLGRATIHLGPVGAGTTMKLATSLMAFSGAVAALEAMSLTTKAGIDVRTASDVVKLAGPSNYFLDRAIEGINTRGKPTEFALRLAAKDARLIGEMGDDLRRAERRGRRRVRVPERRRGRAGWATTTGATS